MPANLRFVFLIEFFFDFFLVFLTYLAPPKNEVIFLETSPRPSISLFLSVLKVFSILFQETVG